MFEKIKPFIDKILGLPGTQVEKEEAWLGINLLILLGSKAEDIEDIKKLHKYLWNAGIKLECFAPEYNQ